MSPTAIVVCFVAVLPRQHKNEAVLRLRPQSFFPAASADRPGRFYESEEVMREVMREVQLQLEADMQAAQLERAGDGLNAARGIIGAFTVMLYLIALGVAFWRGVPPRTIAIGTVVGLAVIVPYLRRVYR